MTIKSVAFPSTGSEIFPGLRESSVIAIYNRERPWVYVQNTTLVLPSTGPALEKRF